MDTKPKLTIDTELSMENKNGLVTALEKNKISAEGELLEVAWDWDHTLWTEKSAEVGARILGGLPGMLE